MEEPTLLFAKAIHVFVDMDKMVDLDFEADLAAMKAAAEKSRQWLDVVSDAAGWISHSILMPSLVINPSHLAISAV